MEKKKITYRMKKRLYIIFPDEELISRNTERTTTQQ